MAETTRVRAAEIVKLIGAHRFTFRNEDELQYAIAEMLESEGLDVKREVRLEHRSDLDARYRIDMLVDQVGIEVKIKGSEVSVARQLQHYAGCDGIDELVLVTHRAALSNIPNWIADKPVFVVWIGGAL